MGLRLGTALAVLAVVLACAATVQAKAAGAPANDDFASAQALAGASGTAGGSNVGATKEPGEPNHAGNSGGASVWYRWTATSAAPVSIDTAGSGFDTLLAVYTGTAVSSLTAIASNDDCCGGRQSKVTFTPVAGTTYRVVVDGYNGATGQVTLHWAQNAVPNDLFASAQTLAAARASTRSSASTPAPPSTPSPPSPRTTTAAAAARARPPSPPPPAPPTRSPSTATTARPARSRCAGASRRRPAIPSWSPPATSTPATGPATDRRRR